MKNPVSVIEFLGELLPEFKEPEEDYDFNEVREIYIARMESEGFRIALPEDNELQIDIDNGLHFAAFLRGLDSVCRNVPRVDLWTIEMHPSKSGQPQRKHVTIKLPVAVSPWQRIALQAALGSDPMRELLSALRLMRGDSYPTLFVETGPDLEGSEVL